MILLELNILNPTLTLPNLGEGIRWQYGFLQQSHQSIYDEVLAIIWHKLPLGFHELWLP